MSTVLGSGHCFGNWRILGRHIVPQGDQRPVQEDQKPVGSQGDQRPVGKAVV